MAFVCTDSDHKNLDEFLGRVLEAHMSGQITKDRAVIILAHVIMAAVSDSHSEFASCIRLPLEKYPLDVHRA